MPRRAKTAARQAVLLKWRFVPDKTGNAGVAKYWWSEGSKSERKKASYLEAIARLKNIQDNGGVNNDP